MIFVKFDQKGPKHKTQTQADKENQKQNLGFDNKAEFPKSKMQESKSQATKTKTRVIQKLRRNQTAAWIKAGTHQEAQPIPR